MSADWLLPLLLILACIHKAHPGCGPVEEGKSTTLTCDVNTASCGSTALTWEAETASGPVATCRQNVCGGGYTNDGSFSASYTSDSSTLTVHSVSRTDPFNMETRWTCRQCGQTDRSISACDKLEVYALPENPECTVSEVPGSGDIWSVTVSCSTTKVYPQARCSFYRERIVPEGNRIKITEKGSLSQQLPGESPVYYSSRCSVSVSVLELGQGTHSFQGYIYPDVPRGEKLVNVVEPSKTVTLSLPVTNTRINCSRDMVHGYFQSKSARCTCSLRSEGYPRGWAQWFREDGDQTLRSDGYLDVGYHKDILETNSVEIYFPSYGDRTCDNSTQVLVTCGISTEKVSPEPIFSLLSGRLTFDTQGSVTVHGNLYEQQFVTNPAVAGEYQVICGVINTVLDTVEKTPGTVRIIGPPPSPPQVTVEGLSNTVTLAEGYTGDVTCRVEGGYPDAHNTQLKCGNLEGSVGGKTSTLSFTTDSPLTRDMDGTVCVCKSQHVSGCYSDNQSTLTLNVVYPPEVTFTQHPPKSQPLREGDDLELTCSVQGNPDPTSVTLTRERTSEVLENVQTTELTHTINHLSCLDTGLYICSGQNSQGTTTESIGVEVLCPQRFLPNFDPPPAVGAATGETAHIDLEIYGFPEPRELTLSRLIDGVDLTSPPRHSVKYTAREAPFGFVNVTISDVIDTDFTNYTLTVDNGEGEALTYSFYLCEEMRMHDNATGDVDRVSIDVGVGVAVLVILVVVVVVVMVLLCTRGRSLESTNQYVTFTRNQPSYANLTPRSVNLPPSENHYELVGGGCGPPATSTNHYEPLGCAFSPPATSTNHYELLGCAFSPPATSSNHYDEINDLQEAPSPKQVEYLTPTSGLYNTPLPQDIETPGIYSLQRPVISPGEGHQTSGPYNNTLGEHGENPDVGAMCEPNGTTVTAGPGANYANVTMETVTEN